MEVNNHPSDDFSSMPTSPINEDQFHEAIIHEAKKNESTISRLLPLTENATNSHPLMHSPGSAMSPDFPDLIPEQVKNKYKEHKFKPECHSTPPQTESELYDSFERQLNLPILDYDEKLPGKLKSF